MKKLMIIAAMMVATVSANAQFEPGTFSIQPKVGVTASWLSNMPSLSGTSDVTGKNVKLDKVPAVGLVIGAEAEYQLSNMFSLAAGLNYSMQGSGYDDYTEKSGDYKFELKDAKVQLGYVTIPVVANIYLFKGFAVKGGVQFAFLTNANEKLKMKVSEGDYTVNQDFDEDIKDGCEKFDLSIPVGVSYQVPTIPIVIDCRYNIGLSKVNKGDGDKMKNNVIQLTVGYKFAL